MGFVFTEQHREEYFRDGYTVLEGLIPPALLSDLRRQTDKARDIARRENGPNCQRLQPVYKYEELDHRPFTDFLRLPGLRAAVEDMLGSEHRESEIRGVLLEPAERAWCTAWHRDWGYNVPGIDVAAFFRHVNNPRMFNQLNAALYDDHSLWAVPRSHNREDTSEEREAFPRIPPPGPDLTDAMTPEQREAACTAYCRRMPGATPILLAAGDVAFYRNSTWHLGTYVPYIKRATLHDGFFGPEDLQWQAEVRAMRERSASS
jgi:hypothetical protein